MLSSPKSDRSFASLNGVLWARTAESNGLSILIAELWTVCGTYRLLGRTRERASFEIVFHRTMNSLWYLQTLETEIGKEPVLRSWVTELWTVCGTYRLWDRNRQRASFEIVSHRTMNSLWYLQTLRQKSGKSQFWDRESQNYEQFVVLTDSETGIGREPVLRSCCSWVPRTCYCFHWCTLVCGLWFVGQLGWSRCCLSLFSDYQ
jgi:hypothetical protein